MAEATGPPTFKGGIKEELKRRIEASQKVHRLDLSQMGLTEVPSVVSTLLDLKILWIQDNDISELPDFVGTLPQLSQIRCYNNRITAIPTSIGNLSSLQVLWAHNNQISAIPRELGNLLSLTVLSFEGNSGISRLPKRLGLLTNLRELHLDVPNFTSPPKFILQKPPTQIISYLGRIYRAKRTGILDLRGFGMPSIPPEALKYSNITELLLSENNLSELPEECEKFTDLTKLYVSGNKLKALPEFVCNFRDLEDLRFSMNKIEVIPDAIGQLKRLKVRHPPSPVPPDRSFVVSRVNPHVGPPPSADFALCRQPHLPAACRHGRTRFLGGG
jgi:Leucine-rich repeat (LRR) protein